MNFRSASILIYAFTLCVMQAVAQQPSPAARERTPGPSLEVQTVDARVLKIHEMKGKVVLLDFMTTVCPSCKLASLGLQKLYQDFGPKGFHPVAVALNVDSPAPLKDYMREHGLSFPFGMTPRNDIVKYLSHPQDRPMYVPTIVLLDRRGRIYSVEVGWNGEEAVRRQIVKLLAE